MVKITGNSCLNSLCCLTVFILLIARGYAGVVNEDDYVQPFIGDKLFVFKDVRGVDPNTTMKPYIETDRTNPVGSKAKSGALFILPNDLTGLMDGENLVTLAGLIGEKDAYANDNSTFHQSAKGSNNHILTQVHGHFSMVNRNVLLGYTQAVENKDANIDRDFPGVRDALENLQKKYAEVYVALEAGELDNLREEEQKSTGENTLRGFNELGIITPIQLLMHTVKSSMKPNPNMNIYGAHPKNSFSME